MTGPPRGPVRAEVVLPPIAASDTPSMLELWLGIKGDPRHPGPRRLLAVLAVAAGALLLVQGLVAVAFGLLADGAFHTVTHDSVPSIVAAQQFSQAIHSADVDLATYVLEAGNNDPANVVWPAQRAADTKAALSQLALAEANVTFPGECQAVTAARNAFVDYTSLAAQTEAAVKTAGGTAGSPASAVVQQYLATVPPLDGHIDPAIVAGERGGDVPVPADAAIPAQPGAYACGLGGLSAAGGLYTINAAHERSAYAAGRFTIILGIALSIVAGIAALSALAATGFVLARSTHRILNLGLMAAAALVLLIAIVSVVQLARLGLSFRVAGQDSVSSIGYALEMKATATSARADELRALDDPGGAATWRGEFDRGGAQMNRLIAAAKANCCFGGEHDAIDGGGQAVAGTGCIHGIAVSWAAFTADEAQLRASADPAQRLVLATGGGATALGDVIGCANRLQQLNQDHYSAAANGAQRDAWFTSAFGAALALMGAGAIALGVWPRWQEL